MLKEIKRNQRGQGRINLNCAPSSGSVFPIGPTVATCTARDAAGNRASGSFQVKVRGAAEQIVDLIQLVRGQALPPALQASLLAALQTALANPQNLPSACHALTIFIAAAQALSGKAIPVAKANLMIADATRIKAVLGCP